MRDQKTFRDNVIVVVGRDMEHLNRFITIVSVLIFSIVIIHNLRAPHLIKPKLVPVACFTPEIAKKVNADASLKWDAKIAYDTVETKGEVSSYRCFFAFPKASVVCSPRDTAHRKNIKTCPNFPSLIGRDRLCYFIDDSYHPLHKILTQTPRQSYQIFDGKIVKTINEARKVFEKK